MCSRNRERHSKNFFVWLFVLIYFINQYFMCLGNSPTFFSSCNTERGHRPIYHALGSSSLTFVEAHNVLPTPGGVNVRPRSQIFLLSRRLYCCKLSLVMSFFGESSLYLDLSKLVPVGPKWLFNPGPLRGAGVLGEDEQGCIIICIV